jgi:hypothetical protein
VAPTFSALRGSLTARPLHTAPLLRRVQDGKEAGGTPAGFFFGIYPSIAARPASVILTLPTSIILMPVRTFS